MPIPKKPDAGRMLAACLLALAAWSGSSEASAASGEARFPSGEAMTATMEARGETDPVRRSRVRAKAGPVFSRTLPVAGTDPDSPAGRVLHGIVDAVNRSLAANGLANGPGVLVDRPVTAREDGDSVIVEFRGLRVGGAGKSFAFGDIDLAVTPDGDGAHRFTADLPERIGLLSAGGMELGALTIGRVELSGTFRSDVMMVSDYDFAAADLALVGADGGAPALTIRAVDSFQRSKEAEGLLSGVSELSVEGIGFALTSGATHVGIDALRFLGDVDRVDMPAMKRLQDFMTFAEASAESDPARIVWHMMDFLAKPSWGGMGGAYIVEGVEVTQYGDLLASLDRAVLGGRLDNSNDLAQFVLNMEAFGLELPEFPVGRIPKTMIPNSLTASVALDRLPLKGIAARMRDQAAAGLGGDLSSVAILGGALEEVVSARPRIRLKTMELTSADMHLTGEGEVSFDPGSVLMASGALDFRVSGLDKVKSFMEAEARIDPDAAAMVPALMYARGLGSDAKDGYLGYRLEIGQNGRITVNGIPWQVLVPQGL